MSMRRTKTDARPEVEQLQKELSNLKDAARAADSVDRVEAAMPEGQANSASFDALTPVEQSAASLGVHPDSWKPIAFMNNTHYEQLIKANMLDDDLARRIEVRSIPTLHNHVKHQALLTVPFALAQAFRHVATSE